jgi:hypothetical protein
MTCIAINPDNTLMYGKQDDDSVDLNIDTDEEVMDEEIAISNQVIHFELTTFFVLLMMCNITVDIVYTFLMNTIYVFFFIMCTSVIHLFLRSLYRNYLILYNFALYVLCVCNIIIHYQMYCSICLLFDAIFILIKHVYFFELLKLPTS